MTMRQRKEITPAQALARMEDLCARSEQSTFEIRKKLTNMRLPASTINNIVDSLVDRRYIDDKRYAVAFARDKYRFSRWGKLKIKRALMLGHIPTDFIDEALDEIDDDSYTEILSNMLRAKARTIKEGNTFEGRTKLYRFAISRGFESRLIGSIIKNSGQNLWPESSND